MAFVSSFLPGAATVAQAPARTIRESGRAMMPARPSAVTAPRMFLDFLTTFHKKDVVAIPQQDKENAGARAANVQANRENYKWTREGVADASLIDGVPDGESPELGWIEGVGLVLLRVAMNSALSSTDEFSEDVDQRMRTAVANLITPMMMKVLGGKFGTADARRVFKEVRDLLSDTVMGEGNTLDDYRDLFKNIKLDSVVRLDQFLRDDTFGWYRVAGPNPMRITKLPGSAADMFPALTDDIFQGIAGFSGDTLHQAELEGRLYYVDYPEFKDVPTGHDLDGNLKAGYVYAPKCLLAVPRVHTDRTTVLPIAIHCGQDDSFPMYTANRQHTYDVTWLAAKFTVQVADSLVHEAVYHLARTHLLVGIFVCSTYRALPQNHPVHRLLKCHFYGTAFINDAATELLINAGGTIDQITAPEISTTCQLAANGVNGPAFNFNDWMPDKELALRGVTGEQLKYPYRDDILALWPLVNEWVRAYLSAYYKSDADVQGDYELAAWCKEIVGEDAGRLHGFGETEDGQIKTLDYLVRAVSMVIFTASCQHAAVNFSQSTLMQFAPAMSLGGYAPAPKTAKPFKTVDQLVTEMMPDLSAAEKQLTTAEIIGVFQYTTFAQYGKKLEYAPDEVDDALEDFQEKLGSVSARIQERNARERRAGLPIYNHLVPKNIPQSINV